MKKILWLVAVLFCFGVGVYAWKVSHIGRNLQRLEEGRRRSPVTRQEVLVEVAGKPVSQDDLDFEYNLLTNDLLKDKLTPVPDLGDKQDEELAPLRERIINSLVERKMLYQYVEQDKSFDLDNPARFVACVEEWMNTLKTDEGKKLFSSAGDQDRLKTRLCEQSVLHQYLQEKVYANLGVGEAEFLEHFKNHPREFHRPAMVVIRQIVTADEKQAKTIRQKLNKQNFAQLAAEHSITPEAQEGGTLGPFPMGNGMPRFFDVAFTMRPGQISDILKSTYGFHIIMLEKKFEERDLSFQEAIPEIKSLVERKAQERAYQKWVDLALHTIDVQTPKMH